MNSNAILIPSSALIMNYSKLFGYFFFKQSYYLYYIKISILFKNLKWCNSPILPNILLSHLFKERIIVK